MYRYQIVNISAWRGDTGEDGSVRMGTNRVMRVREECAQWESAARILVGENDEYD